MEGESGGRKGELTDSCRDESTRHSVPATGSLRKWQSSKACTKRMRTALYGSTVG